MQGDELNVVGAELLVEHIELAAPREPVIPGADHAIEFAIAHGPAQLSQARTFQGCRREAFVFDHPLDVPATPGALLLQFFNLRLTTGIAAFGLLLGADACINGNTFGTHGAEACITTTFSGGLTFHIRLLTDTLADIAGSD